MTCNAGHHLNGGHSDGGHVSCTRCTRITSYYTSRIRVDLYRAFNNWNFLYKGTKQITSLGKPSYTIGEEIISVGDWYWQQKGGNHHRYALVVTGPVTIYTNGGSCGSNANAYEASCSPNTCICPNGTPTIANGYAGTLCDTATIDCSQCDEGSTISDTPAAGSAQVCIPIKPCSATQVPNSDKSTTGSITGTLIF